MFTLDLLAGGAGQAIFILIFVWRMQVVLGKVENRNAKSIGIYRKLLGFMAVVTSTLLWSSILIPIIGNAMFMSELKLKMDSIELGRIELDAAKNSVHIALKIKDLKMPFDIVVEELYVRFANARNELPFAYLYIPFLQIEGGKSIAIDSKFVCATVPKATRTKVSEEKVMRTNNLLLISVKGTLKISPMPIKLSLTLPYTSAVQIGERPLPEVLVDPLERPKIPPPVTKGEEKPRPYLPIILEEYRLENGEREAVMRGTFTYRSLPKAIFVNLPGVKMSLYCNRRRKIAEIEITEHRIEGGIAVKPIGFMLRHRAEWTGDLREGLIGLFDTKDFVIGVEDVEFGEEEGFVHSLLEATCAVYNLFLRTAEKIPWVYDPEKGVEKAMMEQGVRLKKGDPVIKIFMDSLVGRDVTGSLVFDEILFPLLEIPLLLNMGTLPQVLLEARHNEVAFASAEAVHEKLNANNLNVRVKGVLINEFTDLREMIEAWRTRRAFIETRSNDPEGESTWRRVLSQMSGYTAALIKRSRYYQPVNSNKKIEIFPEKAARSFSLALKTNGTILGALLEGLGIYWVAERGTHFGFRHLPAPKSIGPLMTFPAIYEASLKFHANPHEEEETARLELILPKKSEPVNYLSVEWAEGFLVAEVLGSPVELTLEEGRLDVLLFRDSSEWTLRSPNKLVLGIRLNAPEEKEQRGETDAQLKRYSAIMVTRAALSKKELYTKKAFFGVPVLFPLFGKPEYLQGDRESIHPMLQKIVDVLELRVVEQKTNEDRLEVRLASKRGISEGRDEQGLVGSMHAPEAVLYFHRGQKSNPFLRVTSPPFSLKVHISETNGFAGAVTYSENDSRSISVTADISWEGIVGSGPWAAEGDTELVREIHKTVTAVLRGLAMGKRLLGAQESSLGTRSSETAFVKDTPPMLALGKDPVKVRVELDENKRELKGLAQILFVESVGKKQDLALHPTVKIVLPKISAVITSLKRPGAIGELVIEESGIQTKKNSGSFSSSIRFLLASNLMRHISNTTLTNLERRSGEEMMQISLYLGNKKVLFSSLDQIIQKILLAVVVEESGRSGGPAPINITVRELIARRVTGGRVERGTEEGKSINWSAENRGASFLDEALESEAFKCPPSPVPNFPFSFVERKALALLMNYSPKTADLEKEMQRISSLSSSIACAPAQLAWVQKIPVFSKEKDGEREAPKVHFGQKEGNVKGVEYSYVDIKTLVSVDIKTPLENALKSLLSKIVLLPLPSPPSALELSITGTNLVFLHSLLLSKKEEFAVGLETISLSETYKIDPSPRHSKIESCVISVVIGIRMSQRISDVLMHRPEISSLTFSPFLQMLVSISRVLRRRRVQSGKPVRKVQSKLGDVLEGEGMLKKGLGKLFRLEDGTIPFPLNAKLYPWKDVERTPSRGGCSVIVFELHPAETMDILPNIVIFVKSQGKIEGGFFLHGKFRSGTIGVIPYHTTKKAFIADLLYSLLFGSAEEYTLYLSVDNVIITEIGVGELMDFLANRDWFGSGGMGYRPINFLARGCGQMLLVSVRAAMGVLKTYLTNQLTYEDTKEVYLRSAASNAIMRNSLIQSEGS
jgi:hypothetical protein